MPRSSKKQESTNTSKEQHSKNVDEIDDASANFLGHVTSSYEKLAVLERAISSARNGIIITDPRKEDNPIVYANPSFSELTGYGMEEVMGKNCRFLQGDDRRQEGIDDIRKAIKEGRAIMTVLRNYRKDGSLFFNELTISPVHDKNGAVINFIGVQNDITSRIESERRISEFYSMVSHELRTPLTSVRTSLSLIEEDVHSSLSTDCIELLEIAHRNTNRLLGLVNDILDFRKIESGKMELFYNKISVSEIIDQVVTDMRPVATERGISILVESTCSKKSIRCDRERIAQVLLNLVSNAVKFSPEGHPVTIEATDLGSKQIRFKVSDLGPGIPASEMGRLFEKFQQVDSSDRRRSGGTGLGLTICKYLVEMHGGVIGVDSEVGQGSVFWFDLPC